MDNEDTSVLDANHSLQSFKGLKLPRPYTAIGEELLSFTTQNHQYYFNYKKLETMFSKEEIEVCNRDELIPCARSTMTKAVILGMDKEGILYDIKGGEVSPIGSLPSVVNSEWGEGPAEYAEIGIFNRRIPIILALVYKFGLDNTFTKLGINYTRIPPTARFNMTTHTMRLKFKDESFIVDIRKPEVKLLIAGFNSVRKTLNEFNSHELNKRGSFNYLLTGSGVTQHHLRELLLMYDMYVDPITKDLLIEMNEPTTFEGLLLRANEMLVDDYTPVEEFSRFKGYERFAGFAYNQIVNSVRTYRVRGNAPDAEVSMNPSAVWLDIIQDQSITLIEDSNPIHNCKEKEAVTFSGAGGRSAVTMVKETRGFKDTDLGVISEATPDSGKVGIRTYTTANPNIINLRGVTKKLEPTDGNASVLSTSALLAPAAVHDDKHTCPFIS